MATPAVPITDDTDEFEDQWFDAPLPPVGSGIPEPTPLVMSPADVPEELRPQAIKRTKLELERATDEVERLKPSLGKILTAVGLNLRESAAGSTKQAVGNLARTYTDIVAPEKPHAPGTFKYFLQLAMGPNLLNLQDQADPESWANILRTAGKDLAAEGTGQMQMAAELTENIGGGPLVSGAASLAGTAGASAPALLAAPLGLPAASVAAGLQAYGNNVEGFKSRLMSLDPKLTEDQAFDKAMLPAAITGAVTGLLTRGFGGTERFIESLASQGVRQAGFKAALKEVFKSASLEFPEEYLDQLSQGFVERGYVDPNKKVGDIFNDAALAGLSGFALGGLTTGALSGVAQTARAVSRVRQPERPYAQREIPQTGRIPAVQGQPAQPQAEIKVTPGTALGSGASGGQIQAPPLTTDIQRRAVADVVPPPVTPAPAPPAPARRAIFGGYQLGDTVPMYKIPGVRPGWYRDVSADTARKLGYLVPPAPTVEEWNAAGRPPTMEVPEIENLSPAPRSEIAQRLPGMTVQQIAQSFPTAPAIQEAARTYPGGPTRFMHDLGAMARTPEDVAALRKMSEDTSVAARRRASTGDFTGAMALAGLQPAESYEFATGVMLTGQPKWDMIAKNYPSGYTPPVPDAQWVSAHPTEMRSRQFPSGPAPVLTAAQRTVQPVNWQAISTVDESGYRVIDDAKLIAALQSGELAGGQVGNALLTYLLQRSDLHPRNPIRVIDMTPEQAMAVFGTQVPFHGRFLIGTDDQGTIQVVVNDATGRPLSQIDFITTIAHELVHNNITSKLRQAPEALQQEAHNLFVHVKEVSEGTPWAEHNALTNVDEFFAEALSNQAFQKYLTGIDYAGRGKIREGGQNAFGAFLDIIKRLLKLPSSITTSTGQRIDIITALDQVVSTAAALENIQRFRASMVAEAARAENLLPAGPPPLPSPLGAAQVEGGTAEVGRVADQVYQQREQAAAALETLAYERKQYRNARRSMRELTELATAGFIQEGLDPEQWAFPDPTEGVEISEDGQITADNKFVNALQAMRVPHNPENVQAMQEELYYEGLAMRYNALQDQIATLQQAVQYYQALGVAPDEIAAVNTQMSELLNQSDKIGNAELNGRTVDERAAEMRTAEEFRQERLGRVQALSLEPVADFFGKQVGRYRTFSQRMQAGLDLAQQILSTTQDPAARARAMAELQKWIDIPADVEQAILSGRQLTPEQQAAIMASLAQVFEDFDFSQSRMREMVDTRIPEINKQIRELLARISDAKIEQGMGEVLIADVLNTLNGEDGATGNLRSMKETQELRDRVSAIQSFAMALGNNVQTNRDLFNWLTNPSTPKPVIPPNTQLGTDARTIQMIVNEVARNPDFGSAVLTLINASQKRIAEMPITGLEEMKKHLQGATAAELAKAGFQVSEPGQETGQQKAEAIGRDMIRRARNRSRIAGSDLRDALSQLDKLEVERRSIQEGMSMFEQLSASPPFRATRDAINNSPYGLVEPMVEANNVETTFKAFGIPGVLPAHAELKLNANNDPGFKSEWFKKVATWHRNAQEFLNAFDTVDTAHKQDPVNNPSPASLGFDLPKIRGLRDAVQRYVPGTFLELSLQSDNPRWRVPWLVRQMSKLSLFRQHDFVAKMVGGIPGADLRARLGDFVNHFLAGQSVRQQFRDLPGKLHSALKSHPQLKMNLADYRDHFNEMAHWGRQFGSPLAVGFKLPRSGAVVTAEDMAYMQREQQFEEQLRRRVTETSPTQGVRVKTPTRTLVRPGAFVGDFGLPRFPNRHAEPFIADVRAAYGEPAGLFSPTTDLGPASADPIVQFWNRNPKMLVQHILDAKRQDRTMTLTPGMQTAESRLADLWIQNGVPSIASLDDIVKLLMPLHPPTPGMNVRDQIVEGLNAELRQYRDAAQAIVNDRSAADQARSSRPEIAFSADNEFTKPAAKLGLPSQLYDYGAVTPSDHMTMSSRANHERIVAYATAVRRAIDELQSRLTRLQNREITPKQAAEAYGGDVKEMEDVLGILRDIERDFANAYAVGSFTTAPRGPLTDTLGLLTSAILAMPTVGLRNMTQGQTVVYAMSRAMGLAGHRLAAWNALKAMPKTVARFGLHALDGLVKRTNVGLAHITGKNRHLLENMIRDIGNAIAGTDFRASAQRVADLGLDSREGFMDRYRRILQETQEFMDPEDQRRAWTAGGRRVGKSAAVPFKVIRALFDKVGVQQYDFAINSTALTAAENLRSRLQQLAMDYGAARTNLGQFDPTNPAWRLKPGEWSTFPSEAENADSLESFRQFLQGSAGAEGFQLERSMWNYFQQKSQGVQNPQLMTDSQFDAMTRKLLSEFNASTPANRPSAAAASPIVRNILLLQGYPSDLMLKLFSSAFGGVRDRGTVANLLVKTPALFGLALMSVLIGMFTSGVTGAWEKYIRGRQPSLATSIDRDFYTSVRRFGEGVLSLGSAQLGYLGDLILWMRGEVRGNRGFDPTGRILAVSLLNRFINAARGAWTTFRGAGSPDDAATPITDVGRAMVPFWLELENAVNRGQPAVKQSERGIRGEAQVQGMLEGRGGFLAPTYGPTTVVRRNVGDAVSRWFDAQQSGDQARAAAELERAKAELAKLEEFHYRKYVAAGKSPEEARTLAQRDVWNDYQDVNPAVAALLGRRPTQAQFDLLMQGITGQRRQVVDRGLNAWSAGAMALFGRQGNITREQVAAGREGGGRGFAIPGLRFPSFPRIGGGLAAPRAASVRLSPSPAVRTIQSRIRRPAPLLAPVPGVRAPRQRRPKQPKQPKFRTPSVGKRQRSRLRRLAPSRQRPYAAA